MLAGIVRVQAAPQVVKRTTRLRETLVEGWKDKRGAEKTTKDSWFRVSGLSGLCPRATWLARSEEISSVEEIEADLNWKWAVGTAFHDAMQGSALPVALKDRLLGIWSCERCGDYHGERDTTKLTPQMLHLENKKQLYVDTEDGPRFATWEEQLKMLVPMGPMKKPKACPSCKWKKLAHEELQYVDMEHRLTGHSDALVDWDDNGELEVQELKSCNQFTFDKVNPNDGGQPYPDHVLQGMTYVWLSGAKRLRITYLLKSDEALKDIMIEHLIERDETIIAEVKRQVKLACGALAGGARPERLQECTKKSDKRAKYCPCKEACFRK